MVRHYLGNKAGEHIVKPLFQARRYALICSPYIDEKYADAIVRMVNRGVQVRVISSAMKTAGYFDIMPYFDRRLGNTTRDFDYLLTGWDEQLVHPKMFVVDGQWAVDGSANLTLNGLWDQFNLIHIYETTSEAMLVEEWFYKIWNLPE